MKKTNTLLTLCLALATISVTAQDEAFIYGKIYMSDNRSYEGPIRWGKEEVLWTDVFNASKIENKNLRYLSNDERDALDRNRRWNGEFTSISPLRWIGIGTNRDRYYESEYDYKHQFGCQFGEIKTMRLLSRKRVEVELQSGLIVEVDGNGYNDIGTDLKIMDKELGEMSIDWDRIDKVEFKSTPSKIAQKFGEPLYGTVESFKGTFTGFIQWDHDERVNSDKLDGDSEDGKVHIMFENIATIEGHMSRSKVVLKSGRELELRGSNDVNGDNRGIIITDETGMIVDVSWDEFSKLTLKSPPASGVKYENFKSQKELSATVKTSDGKSLSGKVILDLDEQYNFELFQGKSDGVEYIIPLRNIKQILVQRGREADVVLNNGKKLTLSNSQDVGEMNHGLLVFTDDKNPVYVAWENVQEIQLK
ncbi:hypothetical protein WSM22_20670 [Cytophagales bacterium WSM2-2]|nr:hypothetical protein WSM22_20670 [Cytophagales bacterium WSM2-2]